MVDVFRKGKSELLALTETKLKGNGEVSWCGANGIIVSVQEIVRPKRTSFSVHPYSTDAIIVSDPVEILCIDVKRFDSLSGFQRKAALCFQFIYN